jgi:hypothetical protein
MSHVGYALACPAGPEPGIKRRDTRQQRPLAPHQRALPLLERNQTRGDQHLLLSIVSSWQSIAGVSSFPRGTGSPTTRRRISRNTGPPPNGEMEIAQPRQPAITP